MQLTTATQAPEVSQKRTYRLIIFDPAGTGVLLELQGNEYRLPKIEIPRFTRLAKEVTELIRNSWNLSSFFLFSGVLEEVANPTYFAVLESKNGFHVRAPGTDWFTIHHALSNLLFSGQERRAVESSYRKAVGQILADPREPFCRVGWVRELEDWMRGVLGARGIEVKGFKQLNGCETFSLIRFATTQQPVWFKAVGEPNLHEYGISQALACLLPDYVPTIIAAKPDWHGWLMADAGGERLRDLSSPSSWRLAAATLGRLQMESVGLVEDLADAGCRDLGVDTLLELVDPFIDVMSELMPQQKKSPPSILTREELHGLGETIKDALQSMAALPIPKALGHSDFNPGNIIVSSERCTFIDWAEAYVGNPFLTFEYFLAHLHKDYPQVASFETDFRTCYSQAWSSIASPEQIAEAYLYSPLIAVHAYAAGGHFWKNPERLKIPRFQSYLRSLARRMKQEADLLQRRRIECLN